MGKRVAPSSEEQAAKLRRRAMELQNKGMLHELQTICKARPDLVPLLLQHAYSLGAPRHLEHSDGTTPVDGDATTPLGAQRRHSDGTTPLGAQLEADDAESSHRRGDVSATIPRQFQTWGAVPAQYFVHVLAAAEPIALSQAQLRTLSSKSSKHVPKARLLEIWEMITNLQKDDEVPSCARSVQKLVAAVTKFNEEQGSPCKQMRMPPNWNLDGKFSLDIQADPPTVTKRRSKESKEIPQAFLESVTAVNNVYIAKNYSERDACLVDPDGFARCPLNVFFPMVPYMAFGKSADDDDDGEEPADEKEPEKPKEFETPLKENKANKEETYTPPSIPAK